MIGWKDRLLLIVRILLGKYTIDCNMIERMYDAGSPVLEDTNPKAITHVLGSISQALGIPMTYADGFRAKEAELIVTVVEVKQHANLVEDIRDRKVRSLANQIREVRQETAAAIAADQAFVVETERDLKRTRTIAALAGVELEAEVA